MLGNSDVVLHNVQIRHTCGHGHGFGCGVRCNLVSPDQSSSHLDWVFVGWFRHLINTNMNREFYLISLKLKPLSLILFGMSVLLRRAWVFPHSSSFSQHRWRFETASGLHVCTLACIWTCDVGSCPSGQVLTVCCASIQAAFLWGVQTFS